MIQRSDNSPYRFMQPAMASQGKQQQTLLLTQVQAQTLTPAHSQQLIKPVAKFIPTLTKQTPSQFPQPLLSSHQHSKSPQRMQILQTPAQNHTVSKQVFTPHLSPQASHQQSPVSPLQSSHISTQKQRNFKSIDDFQIQLDRQIGKGRLCDVYLCEKPNRLTGQPEQLAAKILPLEKLGFKNLNDIVVVIDKQFARFKPIFSPYVVNLYQVYVTSNNYYIFSDFCEEGTLQESLQRGARFTSRQVIYLLQQFCAGYQEFSSRGIIHGSLTPNKLFFNQNKLKIQHFSIAQLLLGDEGGSNTKNVAQYTSIKIRNYLDPYSAPQLFEQQPITDKCDVWSLGVILFELLFGYNPFQAESLDQIFEQISTQTQENAFQLPEDNSQSCPGTVPLELRQLLLQMLVYDEKNRISWQEILQHPKLALQSPMQKIFFCPVSRGSGMNQILGSVIGMGMEVRSTVIASKSQTSGSNSFSFSGTSQAAQTAVDLLSQLISQHKAELNQKYFVESDVNQIDSMFDFKLLQKNRQICYLKHSQQLYDELHNSKSSTNSSPKGINNSSSLLNQSGGKQQQSQQKKIGSEPLIQPRQLFSNAQQQQYPVLLSIGGQDQKTREMNNIISIQLDKLVLFHRNQAMFAACVLHSLSSSHQLLMMIPVQLIYMIAFAIVGFYSGKLQFVYQILNLQKDQTFASAQEFNVYVASVLFKQTQKFIYRDFELAKQFAEIVQNRVMQQLQEDSLAIKIQQNCQQNQKLQNEIDQLIDLRFEREDTEEQISQYLIPLKSYLAMIYELIDLKTLDISSLRFVHSLQILSEIDVFQQEDTFLDFNFTKFQMDNVLSPSSDALLISVIKFKNSQ